MRAAGERASGGGGWSQRVATPGELTLITGGDDQSFPAAKATGEPGEGRPPGAPQSAIVATEPATKQCHGFLLMPVMAHSVSTPRIASAFVVGVMRRACGRPSRKETENMRATLTPIETTKLPGTELAKTGIGSATISRTMDSAAAPKNGPARAPGTIADWSEWQ